MSEELDIEILAQKIIDSSKELMSRVKAIHGVEGALAVLPEAVIAVEKKAAELKTLSGAQKKELAVEVINILVDIPWLPEALEGKLIGLGIDLIVSSLNKIAGKEWITLTD
jgi:hypothetical protein